MCLCKSQEGFKIVLTRVRYWGLVTHCGPNHISSLEKQMHNVNIH